MRNAIISLTLFVVLGLWLLPTFLIKFGESRQPYRTEIQARLQAPTRSNVFGTDELGRDLFARTMLATGLSISVAGRAFAAAMILALLLGSLAGLTKDRWPDRIISYVISLIHTVPFILLAVALAAVLRAGLDVIYLIVGCIVWAPPARLVRVEVARLRDARFVIAQKAYGLPVGAIFVRSILPMVVLPPLVSLLFLTPELVGLDVGLSYFGLGAQPPVPTIGRLIFDGMGYVRSAWWMSVLPASFMTFFFLALYMLLDHFRAILPGARHA